MSSTPESVTLKPDVRLPLLVVALGTARCHCRCTPGVVVVLFGVFLLIQTASLRLEFEERALIVWQNSRELRRFPTTNGSPGGCLRHGCRVCSISAKPRAFTSCRSCSARQLRERLELQVKTWKCRQSADRRL